MAEDNGGAFEDRALAVARAIFDPSGMQGSKMVDGKERDAIFFSERSIEAFEFTQMRAKDKAEKDGNKLADLLTKLDRDPGHRYKSKIGYFVTESEPTADQRAAIEKIASNRRVPLKCLSVAALRGMLVDAEGYLSRRLDAPFGSTAFRLNGVTLNSAKELYVEPVISAGSTQTTVDALADEVLAGRRLVVTGDFGAGKSAMLEQVFIRLRKKYFKGKLDGQLPIHINLRDCAGLKSASEVLRRHAEEIGLTGAAGLIPAWRAGSTVLLLDGFDEVIPTRWIGSVRDLQQVRWQALEAVRRLVEESPDGTGVLIAGRAQYFSDDEELLQALGIAPTEAVAQLLDFDSERTAQLLGDTGAAIPSWLPSRPLLLRYLASIDVFQRLASDDDDFDEASAWVELIDLLAKREADRISSVDPTRVRELLGRIATTARGADAAGQVGSGAISMEDMQQAFREVCGYEPEEEGTQLLLRLPGLARGGQSGGQEMRTFVDSVLADAAYGTDLAKYIEAPYAAHPLGARINWTAGTSDLGGRVAANTLAKQEYPAGHVKEAISARLNQNHSDAVLLDLIAVADYNGVAGGAGDIAYFREMLIAYLAPSQSGSYLAASRFQDCLIEVLDLEDVEAADQLPTLDNCVIDRVLGLAAIPDDWSAKFISCDIQRFTPTAETTAGLMAMNRSAEDRIALTVLKKVYAQVGAGRKASSLSRGLPLDARGAVPEVLSHLTSAGYVSQVGRRGVTLVLPVKGKRSEVLAWIANPASFQFDRINSQA